MKMTSKLTTKLLPLLVGENFKKLQKPPFYYYRTCYIIMCSVLFESCQAIVGGPLGEAALTLLR